MVYCARFQKQADTFPSTTHTKCDDPFAEVLAVDLTAAVGLDVCHDRLSDLLPLAARVVVV